LTDEARQHLKKVLELAKDDPAAKDALGLLDAAD
jgi:hypothetical protein